MREKRNLKRVEAKLLIIMMLLGGSGGVARAQEERQSARATPLVVSLGAVGFVAFTLEARRDAENAIDEEAVIDASVRDEVIGVTPQVLVDEDHVVHRVLVDERGRFVFGYDLRIEPQQDTRRFKIVVAPMSAEFERRLRARSPQQASASMKSARLATLPGTSDEQIVADGAGLAVELLVNAETKTKIVDVVKVAFERAHFYSDWDALLAASSATAAAAATTPPPRDFTLADVQLTLRTPRLLHNGKVIENSLRRGNVRGQLVWFHLPRRGRFIFSLAPQDGYDFRKIGVIERNRIVFEWGGDRYEWISKEPIIESGGRHYLWVLLDTDFDPQSFAPQLRPAEENEKDDLNSRIERFERGLRTLAGTAARREAEFARRNQGDRRKEAGHEQSQVAGQVRVMIGATDRIERILPRP